MRINRNEGGYRLEFGPFLKREDYLKNKPMMFGHRYGISVSGIGRFAGFMLIRIISVSLMGCILLGSAQAMSWEEFGKIKFDIGELRNPFLYRGKKLEAGIAPFGRLGSADLSDFFWAKGDLLYAQKGTAPSGAGIGMYIISQRYARPVNEYEVLSQAGTLLRNHGIAVPKEQTVAETRIRIREGGAPAEAPYDTSSYLIQGRGKGAFIKGAPKGKMNKIQMIIIHRISHVYILFLVAPEKDRRQWAQFDDFLRALTLDVSGIDEPHLDARAAAYRAPAPGSSRVYGACTPESRSRLNGLIRDLGRDRR